MINLIKHKIYTIRVQNIPDSSNLRRLLCMDTIENKVISNNMLDSSTKLKASVLEEQARTTKFRKKKKKATNNDISSSGSPHSRPYTWFLALPISDTKIHGELKSAQQTLFEISDDSVPHEDHRRLGPEFYPAAVPISKSHITLFLFNADGNDDEGENEVKDGRLNVAIETIKEAIAEYKVWIASKNSTPKSLDILLHGVGHFNNSVIFAKPKFVQYEHFEMLWTIIRKHLMAQNFICEKDEKEHRSSFSDFRPHVTLLKMSRIFKQTRNRRSRKKRDNQSVPRKFPKKCIDGLEENHFGMQNVDRIELLSLNREANNGEFSYYFCQEEFSITQDDVPKRANIHSDHSHCCSPLIIPYSDEDSHEDDTETAGIARRKVALEKENARKSVRRSILSTLQSKLSFHTEASNEDSSESDHNISISSYANYVSTNNALLFIGGGILTIAALKIAISKMSK